MIALLLFAMLVASQPDYVTSDDLNARAARYDRTIQSLEADISDLRKQVELNNSAIAENRGREKVWGTILGLISSGSIALHFTGKKKE